MQASRRRVRSRHFNFEYVRSEKYNSQGALSMSLSLVHACNLSYGTSDINSHLLLSCLASRVPFHEAGEVRRQCSRAPLARHFHHFRCRRCRAVVAPRVVAVVGGAVQACGCFGSFLNQLRGTGHGPLPRLALKSTLAFFLVVVCLIDFAVIDFAVIVIAVVMIVVVTSVAVTMRPSVLLLVHHNEPTTAAAVRRRA